MLAMKQTRKPKRRKYPKLGTLLKDARKGLRDTETGQILSPEEMAKLLNVTKGFIYQVEQGIRKPKDGDFGNWASVYGVKYAEMWKSVEWIPMDLVRSFKEEAPPSEDFSQLTAEGKGEEAPPDEDFSQLTAEEKSELLPFLEYVQWKIIHEDAKKE